jgi:hypothetical protein
MLCVLRWQCEWANCHFIKKRFSFLLRWKVFSNLWNCYELKVILCYFHKQKLYLFLTSFCLPWKLTRRDESFNSYTCWTIFCCLAPKIIPKTSHIIPLDMIEMENVNEKVSWGKNHAESNQQVMNLLVYQGNIFSCVFVLPLTSHG